MQLGISVRSKDIRADEIICWILGDGSVMARFDTRLWYATREFQVIGVTFVISLDPGDG